jgi:SNF2 family DNA or RNA helicase
MLEITDLHEYQKRAINYQCARNNTALWLDMGLGKTIVGVSFLPFRLNSTNKTVPFLVIRILSGTPALLKLANL